MSAYLEKARKAYKLRTKGLSNVEIKVELGYPYASDAAHAAVVGRIDRQITEATLTADELTLIRALANAQRGELERGVTCSPKLKYCAGLWWAKGKSERIARARLGKHRKGEDETRPGTGLDLVHHYHGGYAVLTNAGWALIHALEAQAAKAAMLSEERKTNEQDNHHNAAICPHCTQNGQFVLVEAEELARLRALAKDAQAAATCT